MKTTTFFDYYYQHAKVNSILIMDPRGNILDVNSAFTENFGYSNEEIKGRNFAILFNDQDISNNKPADELKTALSTGQATDENYVVNKFGTEVWCTGETLLVKTEDGEKYLVKDIINLQAKRQLMLYLTETEELLERLFESSKDVPIIILTSSLKVQRANKAFLKLFELDNAPLTGSRLSELSHSFLASEMFRKDISDILVTGEPAKNKVYNFGAGLNNRKTVSLSSKMIESQIDFGKKIFLIFQELIITPE